MKRESNAEGSPVGSPGLGPRPLFVEEGQQPGLTDQDRQDIDEWLETSLAANLQAKEEDWGVLFRHEPAEGRYKVTGRLAAEHSHSHGCDNGSVAPTLGLPLPDSQYFPSPTTTTIISTTPSSEAAASPSSHQGREEADAETTRSRQP
ncbi:uncharacterized protein ACA1_383520 [Acanthamoeba castellanii str. Neff]|uniref:Uncharacterized protein n=1 Tax=Acanthamoeba castellanii (strain ATCC 30010 / Neff) TaxID=1257118 RepID=L8GXL0_ACACF|nr:uncharacterized protein ACA1_383520 [Acanthamoeba castellanii str. Neff]ELR16821.1 hypothetical protein ACA1_383520 [Acanthamoeba castellanii str. Neff]